MLLTVMLKEFKNQCHKYQHKRMNRTPTLYHIAKNWSTKFRNISKSEFCNQIEFIEVNKSIRSYRFKNENILHLSIFSPISIMSNNVEEGSKLKIGHWGSKIGRCEDCDMDFFDKKYFDYHMYWHKNLEYYCEACDVYATCQKTYDQHLIGRKHLNGKKPNSLNHLLLRLFVLKGVFSKPSGNCIVAPIFCLMS